MNEIHSAILSLALELPPGVYTDFYDRIMKEFDKRDKRITELEAAGREAVKVLIKAGNQIGASTKFLADSTVFDAADMLEKVLEGKQ